MASKLEAWYPLDQHLDLEMLESASGAAPLAFINDNSFYRQSRGNHSTNNEGIQQTTKGAPFFVAQDVAKSGWGLGLNNNLHTNTMLKN